MLFGSNVKSEALCDYTLILGHLKNVSLKLRNRWLAWVAPIELFYRYRSEDASLTPFTHDFDEFIAILFRNQLNFIF